MPRAKSDQDAHEATDRELWAHVTRGAKPLERPKRLPISKTEGRVGNNTSGAGAATSRPARHLPMPNASPRAHAAKVPDVPSGTAPGIDRRTAEKLRRGLLAIEARLDLHGHTQNEAHAALAAFIETSWRAGRRCLIVITGKGGVGRQAGVLRTVVPSWLDTPPLRGRILAVAPAQPRDGGAGALYVLLRRQR